MDGQIRCSHILQKHTKSRNPKDSYRNKIITRSPEEALENIKNIRKELVEKGIQQNFARIAKEVSECSSCQAGGDLGYFGKGQMVKAFEEVAFKLKVGELSEPVSTESGIHIILRTDAFPFMYFAYILCFLNFHLGQYTIFFKKCSHNFCVISP